MRVQRILAAALLSGCIVALTPGTLAATGVRTTAPAVDGDDGPADRSGPIPRIEAAAGYGVFRTDAYGNVGLFLDGKGNGRIDRIFDFKMNSAPDAPVELEGPVEVRYWRFGIVAHFPLDDRVLLLTLAGRPSELESANALRTLGDSPVTRFDQGTLLRVRTGDLGLLRDVAGAGRHALIFYQLPPGGGGGSGNCVTSCSTTCGDGSSCTISVNPPACASCTCNGGAQCTSK
jgi:hypothetical protein